MTQLLPNGKQQFIDINGRPLLGGKVYFYQPGTNTPKDTFKDVGETILNTNPVVLDARGQASIYGTGNYRQVVRDFFGILIWDQIIPDLSTQITAALSDLANSTDPQKGATLIGWSRTKLASQISNVRQALNATPVNIWEFASLVINKPNANDPGTWDWTPAMNAFFSYCVTNQIDGDIPGGQYSVIPGQVVISSGWANIPFPNIYTAGHAATIIATFSDVGGALIAIDNGTATSAVFRLFNGGSLGGITFVDSFPLSTVTNRHGLMVRGVRGIKFGYMKGVSLRGDLLRFDRKLFGGSNPDPYNVSFCEFEGVESNGSLGYGINNDNSVGVTHCEFKFIRVVDGVGGGIRSPGVASKYSHISMGNQRGYAIDIPFDLLTGGRTIIELLELDNCEKAYNIEATSGLDIKESRIVHRFQAAPNTSAVYWPTICYNIGATSRNVTSLNILGLHRVDAGGTLASLGKFVDLNNSPNTRGVEINLDVADNGALGITNDILVLNLAGTALDTVVYNRGLKIASTKTIIGCSVRGSAAISVGNTGYPTSTAKLIFPSENYDRGQYYDVVTGLFTAPVSGMYKFTARITIAAPAGTKVEVGFLRSPTAPTLWASQTGYSSGLGAQTYGCSGSEPLLAGDTIALIATQSSGGAINLTGSRDVTRENAWDIEFMQ